MRADTKARLWFLGRFFGALLLFYLVIALKPVDRALVVPFTGAIAEVSAVALRLIGEQVTARETLLISDDFAVGLKNGCNGLEAMLLLGSAILATRGRWSMRLIGFALGCALIQVANLARVVTLFLAGQANRQTFEFLHTTVWQGVIFLIAIAYFIAWNVRVVAASRPPTP